MNDYCIYLRKSRMDDEAEKRGEGETLARHRKTLTALAVSRGYNVTRIYEEVVSGETIVSRPQMQALMSDVEKGMYKGVLVMEVERLARGDTIDQGLVAQTFKYSGTLIITPLKTYDPNDEYDEEFFEFGLFMSRREYKTINRRLKRGREASAREGKWLFPVAPYGYKRKPLAGQKGTTLEIVEEQAAIVRTIFDLYVNGTEENGAHRRLGIQAIAHRLNQLGIPSARHDYWEKGVIRDILSNPVYAGKIRYGYRREQKKIVNGQRVSTRPISYDENCIIADGLHEAIIPPELFEEAQKLAELRPIMPVGYKKEVRNPMAGLVVCKLCGRRMSMRRATTPGKPDYLVCHARACPNVSSPLLVVEQRLLSEFREWIRQYEIDYSATGGMQPAAPQIEAMKAAKSSKAKELDTLQKQLSATYDLLEQGVYTAETFAERSRSLSGRIETARSDIDRLTGEISAAEKRERTRSELIPHIKNVLEAYENAPTAAAKNELLKEILEKAVYHKARSGAFKGVSPDDFELDLFPLLPDAD